MFGIGGGEIFFILIVILMLFGSDKIPEIVSDDTVSALQAVVEELTGAGIIVEVERA